jgi:DNA polymerase elongation subunit (family B)
MLVQTVIDTALRKMLIDKDVEGAQEYTKNIIADLLQNKVDMSQLVITKQLAKADYANKQPHTELAEKMRKRDPGMPSSVLTDGRFGACTGGSSRVRHRQGRKGRPILQKIRRSNLCIRE